MSKNCQIRVPATSANLGPGFDILGLALSLENFVRIEEYQGPEKVRTEIYSSWPEKRKIEIEVEEDIIRNTLALLAKTAGRSLTGVKITEELYIGPARGLGSSAAAIAGTLQAANHYFELGMSTSRLMKLACRIEGHSDNVVPAFLGGLTISSYDLENNKVCWDKLLPHPALKLALIVPVLTSRTEVQRTVMPEKFELPEVIHNMGRTALLPLALSSGRWEELKNLMQDKLHQPYRCRSLRGWESVVQAGYRAGALGIALSGAGPAVLALARNEASVVGERMAEAWRQEGIQARYFTTTPDTRGSYLVNEEGF